MSEIRFALVSRGFLSDLFVIYLYQVMVFLNDLFGKKIFVLSAKSWINEYEISSSRLLMYIRKDTYGTPYDITVWLEKVLFTEVFRLFGKIQINKELCLLFHNECFAVSILCFIVSNTFCKSRKTPQANLSLSRACFISSVLQSVQ